MASTSNRRALSARSLQTTPSKTTFKSWRTQGTTSSAPFKRPRSPDRDEVQRSKRVCSTSNNLIFPSNSISTSVRDSKKDKHTERAQQRSEFREKYTRAFPGWSFYLDRENPALRSSVIDALQERIESLGGKIEDFFSRNITHLITDKAIPPTEGTKENYPASKSAPYHNNSPHKSRARGESNEMVTKAANYGIKIWNTTKLDSVLARCLDSPSLFAHAPAKPQASPTRRLERLLTKEKTHGPSDRDPSQKRHDYRYFNKGSFFVLVEDLREEVATIACHEYPPTKDQKGKVPWPILYCHPQSRNPFAPFDEKEKARWERAQRAKQDPENIDRKEELIRETRRQAQAHAKTVGDLRRSVSLNNLHKRMAQQGDNFDLDCEGDVPDSANASGYLVSGTAPGYMAASGNSVGITSTTGTTSTASGSLLRAGTLPDHLSRREVLTSRKFGSFKDKKTSAMEPPPLPRQVLKKSKSTNTLKLPKRVEGSKPGYCESCRQKFDDFKLHTESSRHRRFAENDRNFVGLDEILGRLERKPLATIEQEEQLRLKACRRRCNQPPQDDEDDPFL